MDQNTIVTLYVFDSLKKNGFKIVVCESVWLCCMYIDLLKRTALRWPLCVFLHAAVFRYTVFLLITLNTVCKH